MQHSEQNDRNPSKLNCSKFSHWFILLIYLKMKKNMLNLFEGLKNYYGTWINENQLTGYRAVYIPPNFF